MSTPNADSLLRESAFAFSGMGRCRLLPPVGLPAASCKLPAVFWLSAFAVGNHGQWPGESRRLLFRVWAAIGYRPIWNARAWTPPCTSTAPVPK